MSIDVRGLRCFLAVVSAGSISRAAEAMHLAQPALSLQIKHIEEALGVALFARSHRGVAPTAAGLRFERHARDILKRLDLACEDVRDLATDLEGRVAIGLPQSMAKILTLPVVRETLRRWPRIQLQIIELSSGYIPDQLLRGHLDIGLTFQTDARASLRFEHLIDEDLVLLLPPQSSEPLSVVQASRPDNLPTVAFSDLGRYPMILPTREHGLRALIERHLSARYVDLPVLAEANTIAQLIELVAAGVGHTVLSYASVCAEVRQGLLSAACIRDPSISRPVYLCRSVTTPFSSAASAVLELMVGTVQSLVAEGRWPARLNEIQTGPG